MSAPFQCNLHIVHCSFRLCELISMTISSVFGTLHENVLYGHFIIQCTPLLAQHGA